MSSAPFGSLVVLFLTVAALSAQKTASPPRNTVSPPQAVEVEGQSSFGVLFSYGKTRAQQVDRNFIGSGAGSLKSLAFRQSNSHPTSGASARTVELQLDLGHGVASPSTVFADNYLTGSRKTVFPRGALSLPDRTGTPPSRPAPFDLAIPFKTPFAYDDKQPLVWDALVTKNSVPNGRYYVDWMPYPPTWTHGTKSVALGTGCKTANGTFALQTAFRANATHLSLGWSVTGAPANTLVVPALGVGDPNANLGWCTRLRTDAYLILPPAAANASGNGSGSVLIPWVATAAGFPLFAQAAAADAGKPVGLAFTNGRAGTLPFVRGGGTAGSLGLHSLFDHTGTKTSGTRQSGGIVTKFGAQ